MVFPFLFAVAAVAQPASGLSLPASPSPEELRSKERDLAEKARRLADSEAAYESAKLAWVQSRLMQLGVPRLRPASRESAIQQRAYPGFLIGYTAEHGQAQWSYHAIVRDIFDVCLVREDDFFEDLSLQGASRLSQFRSSGFQRGHLAPAADFRWSPQASVASNLLANISPQKADFNEGLWAELEISVRSYLEKRDSLNAIFVITGPVLEPGLEKLKDTSVVSIPELFYKVVVNLEEEQGFAFLMETSAPKADSRRLEAELRKRMISIDSLEKLLQIDFFPNFTASQDRNIEGRLQPDAWFAIPQQSLGASLSPITDPTLLADAFNTEMITPENFRDKRKVVGTVARVSVGASGGITLFFDSAPPDHRFFVMIQARDAGKFQNPSPQEMLGRVMLAEGTISAIGGRFRISVRSPEKLMVLK